LNVPGGLACDRSGNLWVVDAGNYRVQKFTSSFGFLTKFGSVGTSNGQFTGPWGIAVDDRGAVYVVDSAQNKVMKFSSSGNTPVRPSTWGSLKERYVP